MPTSVYFTDVGKVIRVVSKCNGFFHLPTQIWEISSFDNQKAQKHTLVQNEYKLGEIEQRSSWKSKCESPSMITIVHYHFTI